MRNIISMTFVFLLLPFCLTSQHTGFEIEVSDTVQVVPDEYTYEFSVWKIYNEDSEVQGSMLSVDQLKEAIANYPDISIIEDYPKVLKPDFFKTLYKTVLVKANKSKAITTLIQDIKHVNNVSGSLIELQVLDSEMAELRLKQKILNKAKRKASETVAILGKTSADLVSIVEYELQEEAEVNDLSTNEWKAYPPLKDVGHDFGISLNKTYPKIYAQKMKFAFVIN